MSAHRVCGIIVAAGLLQAHVLAQPASVPYTWKSVQMVGCGFVDGIVFHPTAPGVRYCRTDMGGAYRWNDQAKRWEPLLDWVSHEDVNLMGVESIAVDPSDPNRVYLACGTYTNSANTAVLRSDDRGRTFQRTNVPFRMGGNEEGRGNGERLAVDPHDGRILYFGSRQAGLWRSADRAVTWNRVTSFPDVNEMPAARGGGRGMGRGGFGRSAGIVFVLFDPRSGAAGKPCTTIYAGVSRMGRDNLYRSTDGGATWLPVPGEPTQFRPNHAVWASDGTIYVSYGTSPGPNRMNNGGVWKLDTSGNRWTDITPDKPDPNNKKVFGYASVAVDAHNPRVVIASSFGRPGSAGGDDLFRSTDGGKTWKGAFGSGGTYDYSLAPYVRHTGIHWLFDIEIDPADSNHALFTTGYGGHETFNLSDMDSGKPTKWSVMSTGIEESVALELLSPPKGAHLITAIGDYGGFVHWDLDKPAPEGSFDNPHFGNTNSVAYAENRPETIVRVGRASGSRGGGDIGYSLDGGKTWQPAAKPQPASALGWVAVSADGAAWVWTPQRGAAYVTRDRGATWTECQGVPANTRVIADRVNPKAFYGMSLFEGKLFVSTDAGASFTEQALTLPDGLPQRGNRGDGRGGQDRLYAAPGKEGDLWLAAFNGLYHSTASGRTFARSGKVTEIHAFGFGKEAPGAAYPALYLIGIVDGVRGIFRSDDAAATWVRINDNQHQWGLLLHITGDPQQYGRVYVGTHGRGTVYGDPVTPQK